MSNAERHQQRTAISEANGYRAQPVPEHPEWAATRLPDANDEKAALAVLRLRGLAQEVRGEAA